MEKRDFLKANKLINRVEDLLLEALDAFEEIPQEIQNAMQNYHKDNASVAYCLRWGTQAATEVREGFHVVVSGISCTEAEQVINPCPELSNKYWDCECTGKRFIHPNSRLKCPICEAEKDNQPDSRLEEVMAGAYFAYDFDKLDDPFIILETYPQFHIKMSDVWLDSHLTKFVLKEACLKEIVTDMGWDYEDFLCSYTWDNTEQIYLSAYHGDMVLAECFVERLSISECMEDV